MSKITLEPNSSGAGTFSIVSPDSNINRTLNLPDESGTVATIDSDGNLLVGTTNSAPGSSDTDTGVSIRGDGFSAFSRDGGRVLDINRNSSDGDIINFRKDGSTVGSIGVDSNGLIQNGNRTDFPSFTKADRKHFFISDIRQFDESTSSSLDSGICLVCPKFLDDFFSVSGFSTGDDSSGKMSAIINVRSDYQNMRAQRRDLVYFGIDATFLPGFNDTGDGKVNPEIIISRYHFKGDTSGFSTGLVEVNFDGIPWLGIEEAVRGSSIGGSNAGFWIVRYDISTAIDDSVNPDSILSDIRSDFLVHRNQLSKTDIKSVGDVNVTDNTGAF